MLNKHVQPAKEIKVQCVCRFNGQCAFTSLNDCTFIITAKRWGKKITPEISSVQMLNIFFIKLLTESKCKMNPSLL